MCSVMQVKQKIIKMQYSVIWNKDYLCPETAHPIELLLWQQISAQSRVNL